ncbi:hypothetical protein [Streptomyces geranii]|uniref:hypothetical protein n=1 Tax=Streptomyces geranii TaxID=2058923 RepID=UPI000D040BAC|nr:hypothetical protein [Streptomyces geranii]
MRRGGGPAAATAKAAVRAAVALAMPLLLGGCGTGIPETDVIEAGAPASVQAFLDRDHDMVLFFHASDGGLSPVIRSTRPSASEFGGTYYYPETESENTEDDPGPVPTEQIVAELLTGPKTADLAAGLATSLPKVRPGAKIEVDRSRSGRITTLLPFPLRPLNSTALRQLTCTIAYGQDPDGRIAVELRGQDGTTRSGTCDVTPAVAAGR